MLKLIKVFDFSLQKKKFIQCNDIQKKVVNNLQDNTWITVNWYRDVLNASLMRNAACMSILLLLCLGVCFRYTKSMSDAEDVLQDGFVKVFKYMHQYKSEGELGGWIRKIMVNTALNYLKTNKKYQI